MSSLPALIDTSWLDGHLGAEGICVLDCSWHLPTTGREASQEFAQVHIPGARFFNIDEICDVSSPYPHMLPSADYFSEKVSQLGIHNDTQIICYDVQGLFSAARVWWMFRVFGHEKVSILNGGLKKWMAENKPTGNTELTDWDKGTFQASFNKNMVVSYNELSEHISRSEASILDARPEGRFKGQDPEPRENLSSGHMPGAISLPSASLIDENGCLKSREDLQNLFAKSSLEKTGPIITTCGSGVTAAIISFALFQLGIENTKLYDGSWSEYASNPDSVIMRE